MYLVTLRGIVQFIQINENELNNFEKKNTNLLLFKIFDPYFEILYLLGVKESSRQDIISMKWLLL